MTQRVPATPQNRLRLSTLPNGSEDRAFTLIELIVVIAIIAMLVGLTVGVIVIVNRKSESRETENTLRLLDGALKDWENASDRQLTWGLDGMPLGNSRYDLNCSLSGEDQMSVFLKKIKSTPSSAQILAQINQDYFIDKVLADGVTHRLLVKDAWGHEIVLVHPGRVPNVNLFPDDADTVPPAGAPFTDADGTIRTSSSHGQTPSNALASENVMGVCAGGRICFVSTGPDTRFGNMHMDTAQAALSPTELKEIDVAADNLYSYPILKERAP